MHADEIRQLLHASPFRPFTIYLASEKAFPVPHEDFAMLTPRGRTLVVSHSEKDAVDLLTNARHPIRGDEIYIKEIPAMGGAIIQLR